MPNNTHSCSRHKVAVYSRLTAPAIPARSQLFCFWRGKCYHLMRYFLNNVDAFPVLAIREWVSKSRGHNIRSQEVSAKKHLSSRQETRLVELGKQESAVGEESWASSSCRVVWYPQQKAGVRYRNRAAKRGRRGGKPKPHLRSQGSGLDI